jgi:two-component system response regulator
MQRTKEPIELLLVEDNPDDAQLAMMALEEHHIVNNITHLKDGAEALDYLFKQGAYSKMEEDHHPKVILLDLKMPKINGLEVLKKIKSNDQTKKIPVVVFTSSAEDPDVKECYSLGVNSYVVKPLNFEQFKRAINEIGLYWAVLNHPIE